MSKYSNIENLILKCDSPKWFSTGVLLFTVALTGSVLKKYNNTVQITFSLFIAIFIAFIKSNVILRELK